MVAMGLLGAVILLVAQTGYEIAMERLRSSGRQQALEAAANVLEAARACPWDELTPAWAGRQTLPPDLAEWLLDARLQVRVEPEASRPNARRVTVEIRWSHARGREANPVRLVTVRSTRSTTTPGGEP
jgi:hypothetical protein